MTSRRSSARRNPGRYSYKTAAGTPEMYLQDLISQGVVDVRRFRNRYEPEQEITEIYVKSRPSTKIRYSETQSAIDKTMFDVSSASKYTPLAETRDPIKAAEAFRREITQNQETNASINIVGMIILTGIGLYAISGLRSESDEVAQR